VLKGWNKSFKKGKTDILPSEMLKKIDYFASMSNCFEPNIASYTMILDAASHCPNPKERLEFSEALLVRLLTESSSNPKVSPTTVTISTVINAFARSGSANAAERAESLLDLAQTMHDDGWIGVEPNAIMYTSVINAWAKAGNPSRAERLLKKMYKDYTLNGNSNVKPNLWSFNTVLAAWSKSSSTSAVESSEKLFRKMIDLKEAGVLDSRPDTVGYNCLLHTLARRRKTFVNAGLKAETLVEEMYETANATGDESVLPNEITYIALLKILNACASVNKAERAKYWVEKLKQDQRTHNILRDSFVVDQLLQLGWTDDGGKRT
jgi:pentatricopeptide repeat protein